MEWEINKKTARAFLTKSSTDEKNPTPKAPVVNSKAVTELIFATMRKVQSGDVSAEVKNFVPALELAMKIEDSNDRIMGLMSFVVFLYFEKLDEAAKPIIEIALKTADSIKDPKDRAVGYSAVVLTLLKNDHDEEAQKIVDGSGDEILKSYFKKKREEKNAGKSKPAPGPRGEGVKPRGHKGQGVKSLVSSYRLSQVKSKGAGPKLNTRALIPFPFRLVAVALSTLLIQLSTQAEENGAMVLGFNQILGSGNGLNSWVMGGLLITLLVVSLFFLAHKMIPKKNVQREFEEKPQSPPSPLPLILSADGWSKLKSEEDRERYERKLEGKLEGGPVEEFYELKPNSLKGKSSLQGMIVFLLLNGLGLVVGLAADTVVNQYSQSLAKQNQQVTGLIAQGRLNSTAVPLIDL